VSGDAPANPTEVVLHLAKLGRELDEIVGVLRDAEMAAVTKRHAADMAESHAYLEAVGSVETRKHLARVATDKVEAEALVAEAVVRYLKARINTISTRVDIGRSYSALIRSELAVLPGTGEP
jgi:hypothetical protein